MRWLLLILAMLIASIPTINCETSIGGGPSLSIGGKSSAQGAFVTNGNEWKSSLTADAVDKWSAGTWVRNARGDYVENSVQVDNGDIINYYNYGSGPGDVAGTGYVYREMYLWVDWADYIEVYAIASNLAGDQAEAFLAIHNGYLTDSFNSAFAGPFPPWGATDGAFAAMSWGSAYGQTISFNSWGSDSDNDFGQAYTSVQNGELYSHDNNRNGCLDGLCYGSQSAGHEHPDGHGEAGTMLYGGYGYAPDGFISQEMYARNGWGDVCDVGTIVNRGDFINDGYSLWAYSITDWDITRAVQYVDAYSYGSGNSIEEFADLNTQNQGNVYNDQVVRFWDESNIATGITHGYW